jgi:hypothetical protein
MPRAGFADVKVRDATLPYMRHPRAAIRDSRTW